jgi:membrane associated rhomboid family serine protease
MTQPPTPETGVPIAGRHTGRETYISCQRCGKPICPDCMRDAAVGFQCPDCVSAGAKATRSGLTPYGGQRSADPTLTTKVLIGVNLLVWIALLTGDRAAAGSAARPSLLEQIALWPAGVAIEGWWWQPLTSMFTHVAIWHLGLNMFALWMLGPSLESLLGRARFLGLYFLSGLAGSAAVMWMSDPLGLTVGASGAIFGLMAAQFVVIRKVGGDMKPIVQVLAINAAITIFGSSFISWQGHLGGFIGGLMATAALVYAPRQNRSRWQVGSMSLLSLVVITLIGLRIVALG